MLLIGEVAAEAGVAPSTIRYYEELGLVTPLGRKSGRRLFEDDAARRVRTITAARQAGFSLEEIGRLLNSQTLGTAEWRRLVESKIVSIEEHIQRLQAIAHLLRGSLDCGCRSWEDCDIATSR